MKKNILLTGLPQSGKSSLLANVIAAHENKVGFVTKEILKNGRRVGFRVETSLDEKITLASVTFKTELIVSKYGVDLGALKAVLPDLQRFKQNDLLFLDEVGEMQLSSPEFRDLVITYLGSPNTCVMTISKIFDDEFIEQIKKREDVIVMELSPGNRGSMALYLKGLLSKILKANKYLQDPTRFLIDGNSAMIDTDHATRRLIKKDGFWICGCGFFRENRICSHTIATEEFIKRLA
jgi:nucleoside-triphosphatase